MSPNWNELAGFKFSIFPVRFRSKLPAMASWKPFETRHPSADELSLWSDRTETNVGIVTGSISGIIAVDCDSTEAFDDVTRRGVPITPRVRTARGWHLYFQWPGYPVKNATHLLPGVDIRGDGGYVVGPGSTHQTGTTYEWDPSPREIPFATAPDWLLDLLKAESSHQLAFWPQPTEATRGERYVAYANAAHAAEVAIVKSTEAGQRNAQLNKSAYNLGGLVKSGALELETVTQSLLNAAEANGLLQEDGARAVAETIASGVRAARPRALPREGSRRIRHPETPSPDFFDDEPPRPLCRQVSAPQPFPIDALGPLLSAAASGIEAKVRAHPAICAVSVLAAANLAVQSHADVVLPSGQSRPISLYCVSVAESGDRKSSVDLAALHPVYAREAALREQYEASVQSYQNSLVAYERAKETVLKTNAKEDRVEIQKALDQLGPPPAPLLKPAILCTEPTFEGLFKLFMHGQPSLGLFSTEGGSFVGGHGMRDEARLRTAAGLSRLWDGVTIDRVRAGDGDQMLTGRRLACHLMLQPAVAALLLADEAMADQGLLSRMLIVAPPTLAGSRFWSELPSSASQDIGAYHRRLGAILQLPHPLVNGRRNELAPRPLELSDGARALWIQFADEVERNLSSGARYGAIRSRANKAAEMAARVAATLSLFENIHAVHVDEVNMERGIKLVRHFLSEASRLVEQADVDRPLRDAELVLSWLLTVWGHDVVGLPEIYQRGPERIRDLATAKAAVLLLEKHGWLVRIPGGAIVDGTRRRQAWRIRRHDR